MKPHFSDRISFWGVNGKGNGRIFLAILLALSFLKLVLVSGNEIIAEPDDALTYLRLSMKYWTGSQFPFRPAAYPSWIAFVHITGIPLRIAIEILLLCSGISLAWTLKKIGIWSVVSCAVFTAVIFHPFSFIILDRTMSDSFYAPVLIFALSLAILSMHSSIDNKNASILYSILSGLCIAILWNTREEYMLIFAIIVQIFISVVLLSFLRKLAGRELLKQIVIVFVPLAIAMATVNISVNTINYFKYSYWGQANTQPSWINDVLRELTRIKPTQPIRYAAVTKEAMEMAYSVSPTLAQMKDYFDGLENQYVGVKGEIGTAGLIFYLRRAVKGISDGSLNGDRQIYADITEEISTALNRGDIPSRPIYINPRVDPALSVWLPYLPDSILNICKLLVNEYEPEADEHFVMPPLIIEDFDKIAHRRKNLTMKGPIRGWVAIADRIIDRIEVRPSGNKYYHWYNNALETSTFSTKFYPRPDIQDNYERNGLSLHAIGFSLPAMPGRFALNELNLVFHTNSGAEIVPMPLELGKPIELKLAGVEKKGYWCLEDFSLKITGFQRLLVEIQSVIADLYPRVLFGLSLAVMPMTLMVMIWYGKKHDFAVLWTIMLGNIVLIIVAGVIFYSIIDACAWPVVEQPRYLFSIMLLYSCFIVMLFGCLVQCALTKIRVKFGTKGNGS
jgi:hypothetical protein